MLPMTSPSARFGLSTAAAASIALLVASIAPPARAAAVPTEPAESVASVDAYYNPDESRGSFELIMEPYPIPIETTTYVNFVFNLPDDVPDLFHAVVGEVTDITYEEHLHHFVLTGCNERVDPSLHGMPLDEAKEEEIGTDCTTPLGGWAPGSSLLPYMDTNTGILMGPALGTRAVMMNVHYTDGEYEDAAAMIHKMATDGIRIHYTTDFRPYSSRGESLINVGTGARQMAIPPGESRFYVTRTCKVKTACRDFTPERLRGIMASLGDRVAGADAMAGGGEVSCASMKTFCGIGGEAGPWIQRLCPATCGFCAATLLDGAPNPLNPEAYRVTGVNYHAHLLGREMYTTLLSDAGPEAAGGETSISRSAPITAVKDLESQEFWIYDYQETFPIDQEIVQDDAVLQGTAVKSGDKIQVTCVYDSTGRDEDTPFGISTYDEMCITTAYVAFETPLSLTGEGGIQSNAGGITLDPTTELGLLKFDCDEDDETDMHVGTLTKDEDARDIWKDHTLGDAEGCTFPHDSWSPSQYAVRCPPGLSENLICRDRKMLSDAIAGSTCVGGTKDQEDSNNGVTEEDCVGGGGAYTPYTCAEANHFLEYDAEAMGIDSGTAKFLAENWWAPKCCSEAAVVKICGDLEMLPDVIAGSACTGGTLDQGDSNNGMTKEACVGGGGAYTPYTCAEAEHFLQHGAEAMGIDSGTAKLLAENWWAPKCCGGAIADEGSEDIVESGEESDQGPGLVQEGGEGSEGSGEDSDQGLGPVGEEGSGEDSDQEPETVQGGEDVPSAAPSLAVTGTVVAALIGITAIL